MLLGPLLLLSLLPLAGEGSTGAESLAVRARLSGDSVRVSLSLDSHLAAEVVSALREGLKSQLTYELRLYRRQSGPLSFLGDHLVLARELTRIASMDLLDGRFRLLDETGQREHAGQEAFLEDFFSLREFPLGALPAAQSAQCYVLARGRLEPVRVVPPLDIVRLVTRLTSFTSPWVRAPIESQTLSP